MLWQITSFPKCQHHVFLSHCAVDRLGLVYPVYEALKQRGIIPWLDRHHYYYGRDWASDQIDSFLHREQDLALDLAKVVVPGQPVHQALAGRPGLVERITRFDPGPIP